VLRKADERKALSCPLAFDALPTAVPVKRLAKAAISDKWMEQEQDLLAAPDPTATPGLFAGPAETGRHE
jgi:hypothetical protein